MDPPRLPAPAPPYEDEFLPPATPGGSVSPPRDRRDQASLLRGDVTPMHHSQEELENMQQTQEDIRRERLRLRQIQQQLQQQQQQRQSQPQHQPFHQMVESMGHRPPNTMTMGQERYPLHPQSQPQQRYPIPSQPHYQQQQQQRLGQPWQQQQMSVMPPNYQSQQYMVRQLRHLELQRQQHQQMQQQQRLPHPPDHGETMVGPRQLQPHPFAHSQAFPQQQPFFRAQVSPEQHQHRYRGYAPRAQHHALPHMVDRQMQAQQEQLQLPQPNVLVQHLSRPPLNQGQQNSTPARHPVPSTIGLPQQHRPSSPSQQQPVSSSIAPAHQQEQQVQERNRFLQRVTDQMRGKTIEEIIFFLSDQWERKVQPLVAGQNNKIVMLQFLSELLELVLVPLTVKHVQEARKLFELVMNPDEAAWLTEVITQDIVHDVVMRLKEVKAEMKETIVIVVESQIVKLRRAVGIVPVSPQQQQQQQQQLPVQLQQRPQPRPQQEQQQFNQQQTHQIQPEVQPASENQVDDDEVEVIEEVRSTVANGPLPSTATPSSNSTNPPRRDSSSPPSPTSRNKALLSSMFKNTMAQFNSNKKPSEQPPQTGRCMPVLEGVESTLSAEQATNSTPELDGPTMSGIQSVQSSSTVGTSPGVQERALAILSERWRQGHAVLGRTGILEALQVGGEVLLTGDVSFEDFVSELVTPLNLNDNEVTALKSFGCEKTKEWLRGNIDVGSNPTGSQGTSKSSAPRPKQSPAKPTVVSSIKAKSASQPPKPPRATTSVPTTTLTTVDVSPSKSTPSDSNILPRYVFKYQDEFFVKPPMRNESLAYTVLVLQEPGKEDNLIFVFTKHEVPKLTAGEAVPAESAPMSMTAEGCLVIKLVFGGKPIQVCLIRRLDEFRRIFLNEPNNQVRSSHITASDLKRLTLEYEKLANMSYLPYDVDAFRNSSRLFSAAVRRDIICKCILGEPKGQFREQFRHRYGLVLRANFTYTAIVLEYVVLFVPNGMSFTFMDQDRPKTLYVDNQLDEICFGEDEDTLQVREMSTPCTSEMHLKLYHQYKGQSLNGNRSLILSATGLPSNMDHQKLVMMLRERKRFFVERRDLGEFWSKLLRPRVMRSYIGKGSGDDIVKRRVVAAGQAFVKLRNHRDKVEVLLFYLKQYRDTERRDIDFFGKAEADHERRIKGLDVLIVPAEHNKVCNISCLPYVENRLQFRSEGSDTWTLGCPESRAPLSHVAECGVVPNAKVAKESLREKLKQNIPFLTSLERLNSLFADKKDPSKQTDHFMCWKCFLEARPFSSFHQDAAHGNSCGVSEAHFTKNLLVRNKRAFLQQQQQQQPPLTLPPSNFLFPGRPPSAAGSPGSRHLSPASGQNSPAGASPGMVINQQPPIPILTGNLPEVAAKARQVLEVANKNQGASSAKELKKTPSTTFTQREASPKKRVDQSMDRIGTKIKDKADGATSSGQNEENRPAIVEKAKTSFSSSDELRKVAMLQATEKTDRRHEAKTRDNLEEGEIPLSDEETETSNNVEQGNQTVNIASRGQDQTLDDVSDEEMDTTNKTNKNQPGASTEDGKASNVASIEKAVTLEDIRDADMDVGAAKKNLQAQYSDISDNDDDDNDNVSGTTAELSDIHGSRLNSPEENLLQEDELQTSTNDTSSKEKENAQSTEENHSQVGLDTSSRISPSLPSATTAVEASTIDRSESNSSRGESATAPKANQASRLEAAKVMETEQSTVPESTSSAATPSPSVVATNPLANFPSNMSVITVTSKPSDISDWVSNESRKKEEKEVVKDAKPKALITVEPVNNVSPIIVDEEVSLPEEKKERKKNVKMRQFLNMLFGETKDSQVLISQEERRLANEAYECLSRPEGVTTLHAALSQGLEPGDEALPGSSKKLPYHIPPTPPPDSIGEEEIYKCNICNAEFNHLKDYEIHREMGHMMPMTEREVFGEATNEAEADEHERRLNWNFDMSKAGQEEAEHTDESSDEDEAASPAKRIRLASSSSSSSIFSTSGPPAKDYAADCEMSDEEGFQEEVERDKVIQGIVAMQKEMQLKSANLPGSISVSRMTSSEYTPSSSMPDSPAPLEVIKLDKKKVAIDGVKAPVWRKDGFFCYDCLELVPIERVAAHPHQDMSYFCSKDSFVFRRVRVAVGFRHDQEYQGTTAETGDQEDRDDEDDDADQEPPSRSDQEEEEEEEKKGQEEAETPQERDNNSNNEKDNPEEGKKPNEAGSSVGDQRRISSSSNSPSKSDGANTAEDNSNNADRNRFSRVFRTSSSSSNNSSERSHRSPSPDGTKKRDDGQRTFSSSGSSRKPSTDSRASTRGRSGAGSESGSQERRNRSRSPLIAGPDSHDIVETEAINVVVRSVRIGSYKARAAQEMRFSNVKLSFTAPRVSDIAVGFPKVNVEVPVTSVVTVQACFTSNVLVLFFQLSPSQCSALQRTLAMDRSKGYWIDSESPDETMKRLTVFPDASQVSKKKMDEFKDFIKKVFEDKIVMLDLETANSMLKVSAPTSRPGQAPIPPSAANAGTKSKITATAAKSKTEKNPSIEKPLAVSTNQTVTSNPGLASKSVKKATMKTKHTSPESHSGPSTQGKQTTRTTTASQKKKVEASPSGSSAPVLAKNNVSSSPQQASRSAKASSSKSSVRPAKTTAKSKSGQTSVQGSSSMSKKAATAMTKKKELTCKVCKTFKTRHIMMLAKHLEQKHPGVQLK